MNTKKKDIVNCKYGLFVHFVRHFGCFADGRKPETVNELTASFDVEAFADSVAAMGVEYMILTAWHYNVEPLYPSAVTEKWRPGSSSERDLLGEILDSMNARNIPVILYTHPRDGHDFSPEDQKATGWGAGTTAPDEQTPDTAHFDYTRWNEYMSELYEELAERYASRIVGFYTDGGGPKEPCSLLHPHKDFQIVNYLKIRDIMKSHNPNLISFQNYYGETYANDFGNSETYTFYINSVIGHDNIGQWQCASRVATTLVPFSTSWFCGSGKRGEHTLKMSVDIMLRYILFNASAAKCGGTLIAGGPYADGSLWPVDIPETGAVIGKELARFQDSVLDAKISLSYPTFAGSTLDDNRFRFWMTGENDRYEYLHCLKLPEDGILEWTLPEDQILLSNPTAVTGDIRITEFVKSSEGYTLRFTGTPDTLDTVIRFTRVGTSVPCGYEWINNTDTRICYLDDWYYTASWIYNKTRIAEGCYERDTHCSKGNESAVYLAFTGNIVEVYGIYADGNGAADVYIDGVFCGTIDEQAETHKAGALCFTSIPLHGGQHVIQLYIKNDKPFYLDAFRILQ